MADNFFSKEYFKQMEIFYDDIQEGVWFQGLHSGFDQLELHRIPDNPEDNPSLVGVLAYDRPDIILTYKNKPILVIERTIEVPSGHNVGQRYARLAAGAEAGVPVVYIFPYVARKHGGDTEGPRYVNLRLFQSLDMVTRLTGTAITTINWPVDADCEIITNPSKDIRMKEYINLFLDSFYTLGIKDINKAIVASAFQKQQIAERVKFAATRIRKAKQYDNPPDSVKIVDKSSHYIKQYVPQDMISQFDEFVIYKIGMNYVRSDPYTGAAMLYRYLYVLGNSSSNRGLVLYFPGITIEKWRTAAKSGHRKDVRIFKYVSEGIIFKDGFLSKKQL